MPVDMEKLLRSALSEVEQSKQHDALEDRFKQLEDKPREITMADVMRALESASDAELDALQGTILGSRAAEVLDDRADDNGTPPPRRERKPKPRTRPGRKSGAAYDWWVDDETGEIVKLDMARV